MNPKNFFAELKRRNVYKVAVAYVVVAWLIIQVATQVFPFFEIPNWAIRLVVLLLILGFPVALILAWAFEITPEGIKLESEVAPNESITRRTGRKLIGVTIAVAVIAAGLFVFQLLRPSLTSVSLPPPTPAVAAAPAVIPAKSIAVLPFENLSADKDNAYFASGMQDMVLTKLAGIGDLKVISRTSTEKYASHPDDLKAIARQLGVATILEGSVQKSGNQVLINVQLINAASDNHLWADAYPRTLNNIFGVEGEVAQKVADALKAKLTAAESARVAKPPTQNAAALDAFLHAEYQLKQAINTSNMSTFLAADAGYEKAIALDPDFALAYAQLVYSQLSRHWNVKPLTAPELAAVKVTIDHALALAPNLPEAHLALGYYDYWGFRRYHEAIVEFKRTLQLAPSNALALSGLGYIARRTGQMQQSLGYLKRAISLSPRDADLFSNCGNSLQLVRRYRDAEQQLQSSLALAPDNANARETLLFNYLFGTGDVASARAAYRPPPLWNIPFHNFVAGDLGNLINARAYPDFFDRHFAEALHDWDSAPTGTEEERRTGRVARVAIRVIAGESGQIQPECAQLASQLKTELAANPDSLSLLQQQSWVEVCLGRDAEAIAAARRAVAVLPVAKDSYFGANQLVGLAQIAAHAHALDLALQMIDQLMAMPAGDVMSIERLKLDPVWDPLRKDPRFQKLIADGEAAQARDQVTR
jgi:TolB-like protein